jgi:hypothetical protein
MDREFREYQRHVLGEFAHIGEATEEEVADQRQADQEAEEQEAALAAREAAEEAVEEWTGFAQEEAVQAFRENEEQLAEAEDRMRIQALETELARAAEMAQEVRHDEEVDPEHRAALEERLAEAEQRFAEAMAERERAEIERQRTLTEQLRAQVTQEQVAPQMPFPGEPIRFETAEAQPQAARIQPVDAARITTGTITANNLENIWVQGNVTAAPRFIQQHPRRYAVNYDKVNSVKDIVKVMKAMYAYHNFSQKQIEEFGIEHLVDRVDDNNHHAHF